MFHPLLNPNIGPDTTLYRGSCNSALRGTWYPTVYRDTCDVFAEFSNVFSCDQCQRFRINAVLARAEIPIASLVCEGCNRNNRITASLALGARRITYAGKHLDEIETLTENPRPAVQPSSVCTWPQFRLVAFCVPLV